MHEAPVVKELVVACRKCKAKIRLYSVPPGVPAELKCPKCGERFRIMIPTREDPDGTKALAQLQERKKKKRRFLLILFAEIGVLALLGILGVPPAWGGALILAILFTVLIRLIGKHRENRH